MGPLVTLVASAFSVLLFLLCAWLTKASYWRIAAALMGGLVAAGLNVGWDVVAFQTGWWTYGPAQAHAPILAYAPTLFWFGGGLGLVGWRMIREWGARGELGFFLGFTLLGFARDQIYAAGTGVFTFGAGYLPLVMDAVLWLSLAIAVQLIMRLLVGPIDVDPLGADRFSPTAEVIDPDILEASLHRSMALEFTRLRD